MALRGNRIVPGPGTDISATCEVVAERGYVAVIITSGSGVAIGDSRNEASVVANPSGYKVHGVLLNDVVNVDETQFHRNWHTDNTKVGEPANVLRKGRITTNAVVGTPAVGGTAYLTSSGLLDATGHTGGGTVAKPIVGEFRSIKDADGYVCVDVNLPVL